MSFFEKIERKYAFSLLVLHEKEDAFHSKDKHCNRLHKKVSVYAGRGFIIIPESSTLSVKTFALCHN